MSDKELDNYEERFKDAVEENLAQERVKELKLEVEQLEKDKVALVKECVDLRNELKSVEGSGLRFAQMFFYATVEKDKLEKQLEHAHKEYRDLMESEYGTD